MPQQFPLPYRQINKSAHMHARGNLSYRQFIKVVQTLWGDAHPCIPILASGGDQHATYPVVIYSLQLRKPHPTEPKPRLREEIYTPVGEEAKIISGQRFQNIINFSIITERNPDLAEELIEAFEDFMLEYTPVFKELGISEFVYARRLPDDEENRKGEGICKRTVSYLVTTEKVIQTAAAKLEKVLVRARVAMAAEHPTFQVDETGVFRVFGLSVEEGGLVQFMRRAAEVFPSGVTEGMVYAVYAVTETSDGNLAYVLSEQPQSPLLPNPPMVNVTAAGSGYIFVVPSSSGVSDLEVEDQFGSMP